MFVCLSREGLLQNQVPLGVVNNHTILIAQASADQESPGVIRIKLADGVDPDLYFPRSVNRGQERLERWPGYGRQLGRFG